MSEKAMTDLENRIFQGIIRRLKINGASTATTDWEISRLHQLGVSERDISKWIAETLNISDKQVDTMLSDTLYEEYNKQKRAYKMQSLKMIPVSQNPVLNRELEAVTRQTHGTFQNITGSLGFAFKSPTGRMAYQSVREFYTVTLDNAILDVKSGAFSYDAVLRRTVSQLTNSGLRWINYASGWSNRADVAARRAIMTGWNQLAGVMNDMVAEELGTQYYEVSAHGGARPEHAEWQGGVYTKDELEEICGLGDPLGLCGINCYHNYSPFVPGASIRTYTDKQLSALKKQENTPKEYGGEEFTKYEALQEQRKRETVMRATRQKIYLYQEGGLSSEDITVEKARYHSQFAQYKAFSKAMKLPMQRNRIYQDGLKI